MTLKRKYVQWRKARIVRAIGFILAFILGYLIHYVSSSMYKIAGWAILLFVSFQLVFPVSDVIGGETEYATKG